MTRASLAAAPPGVQKQMIGERLCSKLVDYGPDRAAKITGMMLEMNNEALMEMLDDESKLWTTADQAIEVLEDVPAPPINDDDFIMEWEPFKTHRKQRADSKRTQTRKCRLPGCTDSTCR